MDSQDLVLPDPWDESWPWSLLPWYNTWPLYFAWPEPLTTTCFLLDRLPKEIRCQILRLLLYRPIGIVPFTLNHRSESGPVPRYIQKHKHCSGKKYDPRSSGFKGSRGYGYDGTCHFPTGMGHSYDDGMSMGHSYDDGMSGCGPLEVTWTTQASDDQLQIIQRARRLTGDRSPKCSLPDSIDSETGTPMKNLLRYRHDGSIEVVHRRNTKVASGFGVQILRTCQKLYAEGSEILYGENLFVFNIIREPYEGGYKKFRADDNLISLAPHLPGISRDPSLISRNQVSAALQELFMPSRPYPRVMSEAACQPFTCMLPPEVFRPPFTGYSVIFWDSFLAFFRQVGILNASLLTKIKFEGIFWNYPWNYPWGGGGENAAPLDFSDMLRCYVTVLRRVCVNLKSLVLHTPYGFTQFHDANERAENSVAMIVDSLPGLTKLQLGQEQYPKVFSDNQEHWGETVRWSQVVRRRAQGGQQHFQRSIEDVIAEMNREAQVYYEETTSQFDELPFKEAGGVYYEFSSTAEREKAKADRELFKHMECHPRQRFMIYLGPNLGDKFFKWMGRQYPNYRWAPDGGIVWSKEL